MIVFISLMANPSTWPLLSLVAATSSIPFHCAGYFLSAVYPLFHPSRSGRLIPLSQHLSVSLASWPLIGSPCSQVGKVAYVLLEKVPMVPLNWKLRPPSWLIGAPLATGGIGCLLRRNLAVIIQNSQWKFVVLMNQIP